MNYILFFNFQFSRKFLSLRTLSCRGLFLLILLFATSHLYGSCSIPSHESTIKNRKNDLDEKRLQLIAYWKKMRSLKADFVQRSPDTKTVKRGEILLLRPNKLKMTILSPREETILLKGDWLVHSIPSLDEVSHIPLEDSPARFLLESDDVLEKRLKEGLLEESDDLLHMTFSYDSNGLEALLVMGFNPHTFELMQWHVTDSSGNQTFVKFSHHQLNPIIRPDAFRSIP